MSASTRKALVVQVQLVVADPDRYPEGGVPTVTPKMEVARDFAWFSDPEAASRVYKELSERIDAALTSGETD